MKFSPLSRLLLISTTALAITSPVGGEPPGWWSDGDPPAWEIHTEPNNQGAANIGQAKWMASEALRALEGIDPIIAGSIRNQLVLPQPNPAGGSLPPILDFSVPNPKSPEWINLQKSPLLIGQLKAIATPFYDELHRISPTWLQSQLLENQTMDAVDPDNYYPWSSDPADDQNHALATIGQLKSVFSLRFEGVTAATDSDNDGIPDEWEMQQLGHLNADGTEDEDHDGLNTREEYALQTKPLKSDTDDDRILDAVDASPTDSLIDWEDPHMERFAVVEMPEAIMTQAGGADLKCVELTDDFKVLINTPGGSSGFWKVGEGTFEAIEGASVTYDDLSWGLLTRESTVAAGMAGDSVLFHCSAPVDWAFGGAMVNPTQGTPFEFFAELDKTNWTGYRAWPVGGDRAGNAVVSFDGDGNIAGENPFGIWHLRRQEDGIVSVSRLKSLNPDESPDFNPEIHLSTTKEGWISVYDWVLCPAQTLEIEAPVPGPDESIWSQDLPKGSKTTGRLMISRDDAPSGIYILDKNAEWKTPKVFKDRKIIGANPCGAFIGKDNQLWTRDRPGPTSQNGSEDWLALKDWAGQTIADLVEEGWTIDLQSSNKDGGMIIEMKKGTLPKKVFVLLPVKVEELSPKVKDEDGNDISGSEKPNSRNLQTPFVEVDPNTERIAHRELKVRIGDHLKGKAVTWYMEPLFRRIPGPFTFEFRGEWSDSPVAAHQNSFEASRVYGANGFTIESGEGENAVAKTTIADDGFTAVRVNVPPIGFNQARIRIQIEGTDEPINLIDMEVPAVIVIDPGHGTGPTQPGSSSIGGEADDSGELEHAFALDLSKRTRTKIRAHEEAQRRNIRVFLTRENTANISASARTKVARENGCDVYMSIHFNDSTSRQYRDPFGMWDSTGNLNLEEDQALAIRLRQAVQAAITEVESVESRGSDRSEYDSEHWESVLQKGLDTCSDGQGGSPYNGNVSGYTPCRAALIEIEWMSHSAADALFNTAPQIEQMRVATAEHLAEACIQDVIVQPKAD